MRVSDNVSLAPLTTLRLGGKAARLVVAEREQELIDTVREIDSRGEGLFVLGGGSNVVVSDAGFPGTVVRVGTRGRVVAAEAGSDRVLVTVAAGEPWDDFAGMTVDEGLAGLECLAGIPGLVGATPMQNVGAYGQEVSDTIVSVRAYDRDHHRVVTLPRDACGFAYRSSAFRGRSRHVILEVTFALARAEESLPIRYTELARGLDIDEGGRAPLAEVRRTVIELRRKKGMVLDPADPDTTSAGSFFTNPILSPEALEALRERVREEEAPLPVFPDSEGRSKVSAAWLIERAGFTKGFAGDGGRVAVSSKHALALTNRGGASTAELLVLARLIRDRVRTRFGVSLEPEPVFVGMRL